MRHQIFLPLLVLAAGMALPATAQNYPARPIRILVGPGPDGDYGGGLRGLAGPGQRGLAR